MAATPHETLAPGAQWAPTGGLLLPPAADCLWSVGHGAGGGLLAAAEYVLVQCMAMLGGCAGGGHRQLAAGGGWVHVAVAAVAVLTVPLLYLATEPVLAAAPDTTRDEEGECPAGGAAGAH